MIENKEQPKSPEVKSQELKAIVDALKIEWEEVADDISRYWQIGIAEMIAAG